MLFLTIYICMNRRRKKVCFTLTRELAYAWFTIWVLVQVLKLCAQHVRLPSLFIVYEYRWTHEHENTQVDPFAKWPKGRKATASRSVWEMMVGGENIKSKLEFDLRTNPEWHFRQASNSSRCENGVCCTSENFERLTNAYTRADTLLFLGKSLDQQEKSLDS